MTLEEHRKFFEEQSEQGYALNWGEIDSILSDWEADRKKLEEEIAHLRLTLEYVKNDFAGLDDIIDIALKRYDETIEENENDA